jgi:hypothetical protein
LEFVDYQERANLLIYGTPCGSLISLVFNMHLHIEGNDPMPAGASNTRFLYIGELEAFNETHERWCQSKKLIRLSPLYENSNFKSKS